MIASSGEGGPVLAWRQLLRLGNVFTAVSNVVAGFLIVQGDWSPAMALAALAAASAFLYAAGMVLNDAFDAPLDAVERPERPIPSGRVRRPTAFAVGWILLAAGLAAAAAAAWQLQLASPLIVGCCLALGIVLYDGGLKKTGAGPWAMGWCRLLNVLLGASASPTLASHGIAWLYAVAIGAYTVGLTFLARRETSQIPERALAVKRIVKRMIVGFILLDAAAATLAAGWPSGLAVLSLILPAIVGARRAPMT